MIDAYTFIMLCLYIWMAIYVKDISQELADIKTSLNQMSIIIDERGRGLKQAFYSRSADSSTID